MKFIKLLVPIAVLSLLLCAIPITASGLDEGITDVGFKYSIHKDEHHEYVNISQYVGGDVEVLEVPSVINGYPVMCVYHLLGRDYSSIKRIVFSEGIQYVFDLGLACAPNLTELVLPSTLQVIGDYAFHGAPLGDITIPAGVAHINSMKAAAPFSKTVTLHGEQGSYVERYAAAHGLAFEPTVYALSLGDVNADGLCNSTDARIILQHAVGKNLLSEEIVPFADVNDDGEVDSTDARLCLQYAVGKGDESAIDLPNARATSDMISSEAVVYASSWPREPHYTDLPQYLYAPVEDREKAIALANRFLSQSYGGSSPAVATIYFFRMRFVEPDGSWVELQLRDNIGGVVVVYNGASISGFGGDIEPLIDLLR